ncbi:MAG: aldehyde dehydrogenase (NADP(+)) [Gemmatimonadota bacterium]|nr:MAG: aldehyde dehydrogenase (NADP(+)) [Gemmatimonadota bacterium]
MEVSGANLVGGEAVEGTGPAFHAVNPASRRKLGPEFREAGPEQVDRAYSAAEAAFEVFGDSTPQQRAALLRGIAVEIEGLGETLIQRAHEETALPAVRLESERLRTVNQLRLFADLVEDGSWVGARIDPGDPDRAPIPKPDIRQMLVPLGPVAVFGASNFPLAFSVAGGDTASALAAGCTVVCKAHPAHPGTAELTARATAKAVRDTELPAGVFSLLHGWSHDVGLAAVRHPFARAVGFTGSLRGGRALFDAAAARPDPIPVYAEMGSVNPVFLLPSAVAERGDSIAAGLAQSITLGVGQFCTNPGIILAVRGPGLDRLREQLAEKIRAADAGVMLYEQLGKAYADALERVRAKGVELIAAAPLSRESTTCACPAVLTTDVSRFIEDPDLREEMFGPVSILVTGRDVADLEHAAEAMEGQLTAAIHGTEEELRTHTRLVRLLRRKVGRLIFNGYPTGVEVGHAMHHGGPYPATTDQRFTSVGTAAIARFARPVCYQGFPEVALPPALRNHNALGIWRLVNGQMSRADV